MAIDPNERTCPVCSGPMWNNTFKKSKGEMNPKAPDYKCKDANCTGIIWPPKDKTPQLMKDYKEVPSWSTAQLPPPAPDWDGIARGKVRNSVAVAFIQTEGIILDEGKKDIMKDWVDWIMEEK
jgi:hypothetical protein